MERERTIWILVACGLVFGTLIGWWGGSGSRGEITGYAVSQTASACVNGPAPTVSEVDYHKKMDKLWEDHIIWTRMVILGIADDVPGNDVSVTRLLQNPSDMADALRPYYGDAAANDFKNLLTAHLTTAADLVTYAKAGDTAKAADAEAKWYKNADDIASFLAQANPQLTETDLKAMMHDHLKMTKAEAVARLTKNYTADQQTFDTIHLQALMMSDAIAKGVIQNFPEKFGKK